MPLVVLIAPPEIDDFRQINKLRLQPYTEQQMKDYIRENKELMESNYAKMFHIVLVNRNLDVTFKRFSFTDYIMQIVTSRYSIFFLQSLSVTDILFWVQNSLNIYFF